MPPLRSIAKASKIDSVRDRLHPYKSTHNSISKPQSPHPPSSSSPRLQCYDSTSPCSPLTPRHRPHTLAEYINLWNQDKVWNHHDLQRVDGLQTYDEREFEESTMTQANDLFFHNDLSWGPEASDDTEPGDGEFDEEAGVRGRQQVQVQNSEPEEIASEASSKTLPNHVTPRGGVKEGGKVKFNMTTQEVQDWADEAETGEWEDIDDTDDTDDTDDIAVVAAAHTTNPSESNLEKAEAIVKEDIASIRNLSLATIWQYITTVTTATKDSLVQATSRPLSPSRYPRLPYRDLARRPLPLTPDERARACIGFCMMTISFIIVVTCFLPAYLVKTLITLAAVVLAVSMLWVGMLGWKGASEKVEVEWSEVARVRREDMRLGREREQLRLEVAGLE